MLVAAEFPVKHFAPGPGGLESNPIPYQEVAGTAIALPGTVAALDGVQRALPLAGHDIAGPAGQEQHDRH